MLAVHSDFYLLWSVRPDSDILCSRDSPGCPCAGVGMTGQSLLFLTTLALGLVGVAWGAQPALLGRGAAAAACRLDDNESESWGALLSAERLDAWICSLLGSLMVGLSGVFPLLVIPLEMGAALRSEAGSHRLKQLLSFALGGLLGNVFLHLLPEAWAYTCSAATGGGGQSLQQQQLLGLWVIAGFLTFLGLEKMFLDSREKDCPSQAPIKDPAAAVRNGGRCLALPAAVAGLSVEVQKIKISGYLNLLANTIDNFTHGLAVAASFLVSKKIGLLTTMAILLHEIPHEGRPLPGSSLSPQGAFSTLLWSMFCRTSWRKRTLGIPYSRCCCCSRAL
ncbi:zinc transporter ZIP13 isoform X3 [Vombatus ursinus]|uniref:zinc transporter ZIP13 isoform X3 n=1 Tax=Vombatus ursinus TaxID=29139 RepID=UPI000FFD652B|nr:zinc transporter ZIP13 isoform X3 [Vombatus ursinus]